MKPELQREPSFEDAKALLENAAIGIHFVGPDGTILWANKAELTLLGYSAAEYIGHNIVDFHNEECVIGDILKRLSANETLNNYEAQLRCKDGSLKTVQINSSVYNQAGKFIHTRCFTRDISELRAAQSAAEQQRLEFEVQRALIAAADEYKQAQDEFVDTICHEIRNPLNGINGSIEIIEDKLVDIRRFIKNSAEHWPLGQVHLEQELDAVSSSLADIKECTAHQTALTNSVLSISQLEAGKVELDCSPFDTQEVIRAAISIFRGKLAEKKDIKIRCNFPFESLLIKSDPNRLKQIIINLLSNALKFTNQGQIIVALDALPENQLQIMVSDTGIGMTEEEQSRLFNRFSQASNKIYSQYGGSGLGLVISFKLVQLMGGAMTVASEKDKGTTFKFTISYAPLLEDEKEQLLQKMMQLVHSPLTFDLSAAVAADKKILVVDDNIINQKVLANLLRKQGFEFYIAHTGQEAVEKTLQMQFDLIFMDVQMPVMDGYKATDIIRKNEKIKGLKHTPIICISGNTRAIHQEKALAAGMDDFLAKPFDKDKIIELMSNHLSPIQTTKAATKVAHEAKLQSTLFFR